MKAKQPEYPCRKFAQVLVRPAERGADVAGDIAGVERVQPGMRVAQLSGESGQRSLGHDCGAGGHHAQRQWQLRAQLDELGDGVGFGRDRLLAKAAGQELACLASGEHPETEYMSTFTSSEPGELAAAGDDDHTHGTAR